MAIGVSGLKIVVIDDDPTGSQAVHSCPLLLRWDHHTLVEGLKDPSPLLFLLANTRALPAAAAAERVRQICRALPAAVHEAGIERWLLVSRGDSTLRGHCPLELEVIEAELGPFEATLLVPAFVEGGRTTVAGMHLLHGEPVHHSAFAADRRFGYATSFLPDWLEAKSGGRIQAGQVARIGLAELQSGQAEALIKRLEQLEGNRYVVVDAERPEQLVALGTALRAVVGPRRLLVQSAASLLKGLAELPPQPLGPGGLAALRRGGAPGAVLVGSHVPLSDRQLERLLAEPSCGGVELSVERLLAAWRREPEGGIEPGWQGAWQQELVEAMAGLHRQGRTPVLFTSRGERLCEDEGERQRLSLAIAGLMARIAAGLPESLGFLISKGGTTSQTLLAEGLALGSVRLEGQLLPGLSVLRLPSEHPRFPALPLLTLPGNLGDDDTLRQAWHWMDSGGLPAATARPPDPAGPPPAAGPPAAAPPAGPEAPAEARHSPDGLQLEGPAGRGRKRWDG
nr:MULTISPECIES: four-carbon acid sugar kinase family protein [unclassified Synechococcus]